jgi:Tol biopolymer transport system component
MRAERWKQVEDLFEAAQKQPPDRRAEFLRQAYPGDPELCAEVESLLKAAESRDPLLDGSPLSSVTERPPALKPGDKLGNFEIVALIGRGGMGEVYRARDPRLKRDVAIKTLPSGFASDRDRIARFEREARAASALNHPNIVSVHDIGTEGGVSFIVSELVDGETLARLIQRGPLPLRKLVEVSTLIADGLAAAHAAGVIHRDLKPGNIMLTRDGRAKILDFGLARQSHALGVDSTTMDESHPGVIMGTPGYMSPEQVRGEPTDARSDLFSLGVILYEMASGKPAFRGTSSVEVMNSILKDEPPELPPASPPALDRIVRRCIEKQPARRFQSAADLGFALQSLSPSPKREERPKRRAWMKWAVLAASAVTVGAVYWLVVRQPRASAPPETNLRRLTNDVRLATSADISADGKLVAYVSNGDIWVQQVDGGGLIRITHDPTGADDPAFSPDGAQIAFRSEREGGGIFIAPALGGEPRELVPQGRRPRFSPDGRWLMYWTGPAVRAQGSGSREMKLFVLPLSGGTATQIAAGCGLMERTPIWSPDGNRILFVGSCDSYVPTAWVSSLDGKDLKSNHDLYNLWPTIHVNAVIGQWIADPPRVLIRQGVGNADYVTAVPVSTDGTRVTGPSQRLASFTDGIARISAALNGRMVVSASAVVDHIWGLPIDGKGQATGEPKQLTDGPASQNEPSLSRDGERLAFHSNRWGTTGTRLLYRDLATGRETELSTDGYRSLGPIFSPDSTGIVCRRYATRERLQDSIYYVPLSGGMSKKIWDKSFWSRVWDWSPNGKTLLFYTSDEGTTFSGAIRQLDLDSLSVTMFLDDPEFELWQGHFSHDGRWVTFNATTPTGSSRTSSRIYVAPFRKALLPRSEWIPITHGSWDDKPRFSSDDKLIFFRSGQNSPFRLWAQKVGSGMHPDGEPVAVYPSGQRQPSVLIANDEISVGPQLIVFTQSESTGNIWLLEPAKGAK